MRLVIIASVAKEVEAIGTLPSHVTLVESGIGRTNAACATTEAILRAGSKPDAVLNVGIAGALPRVRGDGSGGDVAAFSLVPGDVILASESVYAEEGLLAPDGFHDVGALGFPLGAFAGNAVPADAGLVDRLRDDATHVGRIATVATCSGVDHLARLVATRTGARAEAMEGAAVVHAAGRLGVPAAELRVISNTTGDREEQRWELARAFEVLGARVQRAIEQLG